MRRVAQWAAAACSFSLPPVPRKNADAFNIPHASKLTTPANRPPPHQSTSGEKLVRSRIGCVACVLLMLACALDHGRDTFDLAVLPGTTAFLLLVTGLPHGALDIELLEAKAGGSTPSLLGHFVVAYIGAALSVIVFWYLIPTGALIFLLLLSAYHFGGDWSGLDIPAERLMVGACVLSAPALRHEEAVSVIFSWLVVGNAATSIAGVMHWISSPLLFGVATLALVRWQKNRAQCEEIVTVCFAAVLLPPLTFFVIYFGALHSMRHLAGVSQTLSCRSIRELIAHSAPYAVTAFACCGAGVLWFSHLPTSAAFLSASFIGLMALTVPHMILEKLSRVTLNAPLAAALNRSRPARLFRGRQ